MNKNIKIFVLVFMQFLLSVSLYAQKKDVTQFLGIPVDGTKSEMIAKLKAKGYTGSSYDKDILVGEFNGTKVNIHIGTNNNKVYRIMVTNAIGISEGDIKIRFNNLCRQFQDNKKYVSATLSDQTISEDEDISYKMSIKNKQYQAAFYQLPSSDSKKLVWFTINELYGEYYISIYYDNEYNRAQGEDL
ncbi:MAG: hypothetical protein LBP85_00665 [Prevotellaceae bacterium]|jgi:hypothetical protein|nr:hypothetical protein [Prevotellaceae bacterium]